MAHPNYVLVAAHRGYWADYPENSQKAYEMAISLGGVVEMDVRVTKDGQMVIFHDACLDRVTNTKITTSKMLSLDEVLTYLKDKAVVSIDIKETGALFNSVFTNVVKMLKTKGMLWQTIIKGKMRLADVQDLAIKSGTTLDNFIYTPIAFSNTKNLDEYIQEFVDSKKNYAFELVYKQSSDPILSYVNLLKTNGIWVGQYSFWPETANGVFAEKNPLTDTDPVTRDYNFKDQDPNNFLDDGRGDWDWLMGKGITH